MAEKKQTLYRLKKDEGIEWFYEKDNFKESDTFEEYYGEVSNGIPNGHGKISLTSQYQVIHLNELIDIKY